MIDVEMVANLIPLGHENAKPLRELLPVFAQHEIIDEEWSEDYQKRAARNVISRVGIDYVICNLQDGCGYFRPTKADKEAFRKWLNQEENRARQIGKRIQKGKKLFEDYLKDRIDEQRLD